MIWETLNDAIKLFEKASGIEHDPNRSNFSINFSGRLSTWEIEKGYKKIKECAELDSTGVTSILLLKELFVDWARSYETSVYNLIDDTDIYERINYAKELKNLLDSEAMAKPQELLKKGLQSVLEKYDRPIDAPIFDDINNYTHMMEQAIVANKTLKVKQYAKGDETFNQDEMVISDYIVRFKNNAEAIRHASAVPKSFIMMAFVEDDFNDLFSHFMFIIKRGENIYTLTDEINFIHSKQKELISGRRGGARFHESNIAECFTYFPYELIEGWRVEGHVGTDIMIAGQNNKESGPKARFANVRTESLLWTYLVTEKIKERFFSNSVPQIENLIKFSTRTAVNLIDTMKDTALIPTNTDLAKWDEFTHELEPFNPKILTYKGLEDEWERKPARKNDGVEQYYKNKIDSSEKTLLPALINPKAEYELQSWDGETEGTVEQLMKARTQVARYNQAKQINHMLKTDFEAKKEKIAKKVNKLCFANRDHLLSLIKDHDELTYYTRADHGFDYTDYNEFFLSKENVEGMGCMHRMLMRRTIHKTIPVGYWVRTRAVIAQHYNQWDSIALCPITNAKATVWYTFEAKNIHELCEIFAINKKDVPRILQKMWLGQSNLYDGNHLLSNLDPMDWAVKNHWDDNFKVIVHIPLSKRGEKKVKNGEITSFEDMDYIVKIF